LTLNGNALFVFLTTYLIMSITGTDLMSDLESCPPAFGQVLIH